MTMSLGYGASDHRASASRLLTSPSSETLSRRLWDIDWAERLPWTLADGSSVERGSFEDALPFMAENYAGIFGDEPERFLVEGMTDAKRRFWREMDVFVLRCDGVTAGICAGHPSDWSTYYVRTFALLP